MKFATLRLLADENLSPSVVAWLRNRGLDVLDVKEQGWQGESDSTLMERALSEERFVLTHDRDFGYLAINRGQPCHGIVYLRPALLSPPHVIALLERLLDLDRELKPGDLIALQRTYSRRIADARTNGLYVETSSDCRQDDQGRRPGRACQGIRRPARFDGYLLSPAGQATSRPRGFRGGL